MMQDFDNLFDSVISACEGFANPTATKRLRTMQQLVKDVLSDFSTVEKAKEVFEVLCDIGRSLFDGAKLIQDVKWGEVEK